MLLIIRADVEIGRDFDAARARLDAALATLREDHGLGIYDAYLAELALWERRWADADEAVRDGLARAPPLGGADPRVALRQGLRAQAELAALARARRDAGAVRDRFGRARSLVAAARRAAAEAAAVTPHAAGWLAVAEAEYASPRRGPTGGVVAGGGDLGGARVRRWPPTAGARPRRSSPPARPAPRRASRSGRPTPSRPGSARSPLPGSSGCSPSARGSILRRRRRDRPVEPGARGDPRPDLARGGGPDPPGRLHQPRDRGDPRHQRQDGPRPRLVFCASLAHRTGAGGRDRAPPLPAAGLTAVAARGQRGDRYGQWVGPRVGPAIRGLHGEGLAALGARCRLRRGCFPGSDRHRPTHHGVPAQPRHWCASAAPGRSTSLPPSATPPATPPDPSGPPSDESDITTERRSPGSRRVGPRQVHGRLTAHNRRRHRWPGASPHDRACLNGILFVLLTGINWGDLPQQLG